MSNKLIPVPENDYRKAEVGLDQSRFVIDPSQTDASECPDFLSEAHEKMTKAWKIVSDVYAGTLRMRDCGAEYLPRFPLEKEETYRDRIKVATFFNAYARTVDAMTGLVVGAGVETKNLSAEIEKHLIDIDNAGTTFEVFARDTLRDAFDGHTVIVVDMAVPDAMPKNYAEAKKMNIRPYWTRYKASEITNWRETRINGEMVLTQIVFRECTVEPVGTYGERHVERYRRWYLQKNFLGQWRAHWEIWEKVEKEKTDARGRRTGKKHNVFERVGGPAETHLERLPVVACYGNKTANLESIPPLLDLALKNIEHFQIDSDYKKGLTIAGLAIPTVTKEGGSDDGDEGSDVDAFGWDEVVYLGAEDDFKFVEASGSALPNKRLALEDIKREMGVLGLSLIAERADSNITATERLLDSVQQSNQLMAIQASLLQALRQAFVIHAEWMRGAKKNIPTDRIEVALGLDWTQLVRSADHLQIIHELAKEDFLSTETLLKMFVKYGVLSSDIDPLEEIERLSKEGRKRVSQSKMKATAGGIEVSKGGKPKSEESVGMKEKTDRDKAEKSMGSGLDAKDEDA